MRRQGLARVSALVLTGALLMGCGQKGPLFYPVPPKPRGAATVPQLPPSPPSSLPTAPPATGPSSSPVLPASVVR